MRGGRLPALLLVLAVAGAAALALAHSAEIRMRASGALGQGMPPREAALARGFVLGEDEGVDRRTVEDFRRSGLSHLLAVSGQNVALLALLAVPLLAAFGLALRARLAWLLGLIVVYVVLAGAGPSIQRAGTMGALSLLATLAGRRASRLYALAVAATVTLAIDPGVAADVGWQLSFAAVLGILFLAAPLRTAIVRRLGRGHWQRTVAEGAALTISATLATAPLIAFHFGTVSTATLLANLLALPAVAPAMWLGMLAAAGAQVPGFPVEAFNALAAPLLAYIAQVAAWCGRPAWASVEVQVGGVELVAAYAAIAAAVTLRPRYPRRRLALATAGLLAFIATLAGAAPETGSRPPVTGLRISVLDVGQGDAILLQPARAPALLVDAGPADAGIATMLQNAGVERLAAVVVSHDQADHAGGVFELLAAMPVEALLYAAADGPTLAAARRAGAAPRRLAAGREVRSGKLGLQVLWPPPELLQRGVLKEGDPNQLSLVLLLRWRGFSMLLPGDAEAESVPLDPGPLDVLKVAHHGSEDAGLAGLLARSGPSAAIVSVGEGNPFGHPVATTLATLREYGVRRYRTDRDGTVVLDVEGRSFRVETEG